MSNTGASVKDRTEELSEWIQVRPVMSRGLKLLRRPIGELVCIDNAPRVRTRKFIGEIEVL